MICTVFPSLLFVAIAFDPSNLFSVRGQHSITNLTEMISATVCTNVESSKEKELVNSVTLRYYFGEDSRSNVEVTLTDSVRLLHHSRWHPERRIALYFFGFNSDPESSSTRQMIVTYVKRSTEYNFVVVDWSQVTSRSYALAVAVTEAVARAVAKALNALMNAGAEVAHIVGHSLGAHAAGATARFTEYRLQSVIALDPAGPLFYAEALPGQQCIEAVGPNDARCVLAVHTCMGVLGAPVPTGHVDFFPGGGSAPQPGCGLWGTRFPSFVCSHERAVQLWVEAVANHTSLVGRRCSSWDDFLAHKCDQHPTALLERCGNVTGEFFLETNAVAPFGRGLLGATL